ncbi:hypothetical protein LDENG_00266770 [Lucifuga dentata]|nr:hypothetical protein LDENG_00266770 [Lucifuga dentata]
MLRSLDVVGLLLLTSLCSIAWKSGSVPLEWQTGWWSSFLKRGTGGCVPSGKPMQGAERRLRLIVEPQIQEEQCGPGLELWTSFSPSHRY